MRPLVLTIVLLAAPVASAIPDPIFDPTCPEYPDYVIVQYPLHAYVNYCVEVETTPGPSATYPHPGAGVGFVPVCVGSVCVGAFCTVVGCFAGPPRPYVYTTDETVTILFPTGAHGHVEATAACPYVTPCRVDFGVGHP